MIACLCQLSAGARIKQKAKRSQDAKQAVLEAADANITKSPEQNGLQGVVALKEAIADGSAASTDAIELLDTIFGGLNDVGLVYSSIPFQPDGENTLTVTLTSAAVGELATKSKVPYEVKVDRTMTAFVENVGSAVIVHMTGLYFAPPADMKSLLEAAMAYKATAAASACKAECESGDVIACESCVAYEWYKVNKAAVAAQPGKMARILTATPFDTMALSLEKQQGNWTPSRVGDKNRRRIIYSMLTAAPTRIDRFIFGTTPVDFGVPAKTLNEKKKMKPTFDDGRYMAAVAVPDFHGNTELAAFFEENQLAAKALEIGKASLIGKLGTTYDYPLDMAEKMGQGTSGINFARMVASANPILHEQGIYVRPAKPDKVMKMLGLCAEAAANPAKIDTGCGGGDGRILWEALA
jgi:hypothetical protein